MVRSRRSDGERLKSRFRFHNFLKLVPIIGIVLLLGLSFGQSSSKDAADVDKPIIDRIKSTILDLGNSFDFSDGSKLLITIILLITLWTGYKYWLRNFRYIRRNSSLLEKLVIAIMFIIFVDRHVRLTSAIGHYIDWALFLAFLYLVIAGTWFLAKTIDGIDLSSDLYNWGLRLIGAIVAFFGIVLLTSSTFALSLANSNLVFNNIYWIASICIILLGAFMEYRSFRRHPAIHVW